MNVSHVECWTYSSASQIASVTVRQEQGNVSIFQSAYRHHFTAYEDG